MVTPQFYPLLVRPEAYPAACLPILPALGTAISRGGQGYSVASAFLRGPLSSFAFGRYALAEALRRAGVESDTAVLLPACHCRVMVEAVLYRQAEARFYPTTADLQPDFAKVHDLVADGRVRALVLTHYFGFPNALDAARRFCTKRGIALIEDCAHAFYGDYQGRALGTVGDYAAASIWKFLPVREGALLRDNVAGLGHRARSPGLVFEGKAWAAGLESGIRRALRREALPVHAGAELAAKAEAIAESLATAGGGDEGVPLFQSADAALAGSWLSRLLVQLAAHDDIARRRREHYRYWLDGVQGLAGVEPLFPELPEGVVPYAFPLLGDAQGKLFHALKLAGVPLWRWEDMAVTDCPVARDYRSRLLQLPCHQGLRPTELAWMLDVLRAAVPRL